MERHRLIFLMSIVSISCLRCTSVPNSTYRFINQPLLALEPLVMAGKYIGPKRFPRRRSRFCSLIFSLDISSRYALAVIGNYFCIGASIVCQRMWVLLLASQCCGHHEMNDVLRFSSPWIDVNDTSSTTKIIAIFN